MERTQSLSPGSRVSCPGFLGRIVGSKKGEYLVSHLVGENGDLTQSWVAEKDVKLIPGSGLPPTTEKKSTPAAKATRKRGRPRKGQ